MLCLVIPLLMKGVGGELLGRNDVIKRGFRGFTTSQYRWIIKDSVLNYKPEICFISGGINDFGAGIPLKRTKLNYKTLLETLVSNGVEPIVQSTLYQENNPESKVLVDSLNSYLIDYCRLNNIHFLDINSKLSTEKGLKPAYSRDGTHLKSKAYVVWCNDISKLLSENDY